MATTRSAGGGVGVAGTVSATSGGGTVGGSHRIISSSGSSNNNDNNSLADHDQDGEMSVSYEAIMMGLHLISGGGYPSSKGINNNTNYGTAYTEPPSAVKALSSRLMAFRQWCNKDAGMMIHPAICIVHGEATDGTKNAPVLTFGPPRGPQQQQQQQQQLQQQHLLLKSTPIGTSSTTSGIMLNNAVASSQDPMLHAGVSPDGVSGPGPQHSMRNQSAAGISGASHTNSIHHHHHRHPASVDMVAAGRIGVVDGDGDQALYDRTMGCQVRAVREIKKQEVLWSIPRHSIITPDLVACSDGARAVLACCQLSTTVPFDNNNNNHHHSTLSAGEGTAAASSSSPLPHFWDAFENTAICESKFKAKMNRNSGPQTLVKILQERKRAESAYRRRMELLHTEQADGASSSSISFSPGDAFRTQKYKLATYGSVSTRAPYLAFLIHQRFSNSIRPPVQANNPRIIDQFERAKKCGDGNAMSSTQAVERPSKSPRTFAPYARTLPSCVAVPLCWRRSELALLAGCISGSSMLQEVAARTMQLASEFVSLLDAGILERFPETFPPGLLTWERWVWAAAIVSSRALPASCYLDAGVSNAHEFQPSDPMDFQSSPDVWNELGVLMPLLDMLNHEIEWHQVTWEPCVPSRQPSDKEEEDHVNPHPPQAIAHKKIKKGNELYCCYGHRSNWSMILDYGFAQVNNINDEVQFGWSFAEAVGGVDPPFDYNPPFETKRDSVFESNDELAINAWWTKERLDLVEREVFPNLRKVMEELLKGKRMESRALCDGSYEPIMVAAAIIATMPPDVVTKHLLRDKGEKIVISKRQLGVLRNYMQFSFTRKLEKLLQNLDHGLKDHYANFKLWTKASEGGLNYSAEKIDSTDRFISWHLFFDLHAYATTMEVEKNYYAMGSGSCVLALFDGHLRALELSIQGVVDDKKFENGLLKQIQDLDFAISDQGEGSDVKSEGSSVTPRDVKMEEDTYARESDSCSRKGTDPEIKSEEVGSSQQGDRLEEASSDKADGDTKVAADKRSPAKLNGQSPNGSKSTKSKKRNRKKSNQSERPPAVKLHIGNLSYTTTPSDLYDYFSRIYGQDNVLECHIPTERDTGRSRGFGFVAMPERVAREALQSGRKHEVDGRLLKLARSNSAGSGVTNRLGEGANVPLPSDRCVTCCYRPKYCVCVAPNVPGRFPPPPLPSPGLASIIVPPPGPHGPGPRVSDYGPNSRDPGYYSGYPERYHDGRFKDYNDDANRYYDYDRDRRRYDDGGGSSRSGDRGDDRMTSRERSRGRGRDREHRGRSRDRSVDESHSTGRRSSRRSDRRSEDDGWSDRDRKRSRSRSRSRSHTGSRERSRKKKSRRRHRSRSRSRSSSFNGGR